MSARNAKRGYTLIEVMVALSVLAVGATSIIALQKATFVSNTNAKNLVLATNIATTWAERMRVDGLQWNEVGDIPDLGSDPVWLRTIDTLPFPNKGAPLMNLQFGSPQFDVLGADIYDVPESPAYCTHLRYSRFTGTNGAPLWPNLVRVEIRVFWNRNGGPIDCAIAPATVDAEPYNYGAVYLTTSVLRNKSPL